PRIRSRHDDRRRGSLAPVRHARRAARADAEGGAGGDPGLSRAERRGQIDHREGPHRHDQARSRTRDRRRLRRGPRAARGQEAHRVRPGVGRAVRVAVGARVSRSHRLAAPPAARGDPPEDRGAAGSLRPVGGDRSAPRRVLEGDEAESAERLGAAASSRGGLSRRAADRARRQRRARRQGADPRPGGPGPDDLLLLARARGRRAHLHPHRDHQPREGDRRRDGARHRRVGGGSDARGRVRRAPGHARRRAGHPRSARRAGALTVVDRVAGALGIDGVQWRALVRAYLRMDVRASGGPVRRRGAERGRSQITAIAIVGAVGGMAFAFVAAATADILMSASLLTTYAAATTMMMLLVDFTGVVLAPEDYGIRAPRPIGSRTYFAARLAAVGAYVGVLSVATSAIPVVVYGVKAGPLAGAAALAGVLLCDLCTTVLVITAYVTLLR